MAEPLFSGANHEKVIAAHPEWDEFDWCRYWTLDERKIEKKYAVKFEEITRDCGEKCRCKSLIRG